MLKKLNRGDAHIRNFEEYFDRTIKTDSFKERAEEEDQGYESMQKVDSNNEFSTESRCMVQAGS